MIDQTSDWGQLGEGKSLPTQDKEVPIGGKATEAEAVAEEDRKGKRRKGH